MFARIQAVVAVEAGRMAGTPRPERAEMSRAAVTTLIVAGLLPATACAGAAPTPSPTPTPAPSPTAAATALPTSGELTPGRYFVDSVGYRYTFTVPGPTEWDRVGDDSNILIRHDPRESEHAIMWLWGPLSASETIYRDPCQWFGTGFNPGPSVDDYATALTTIDTWRATPPTDVTVGGRPGKRVQLTVPADADFATCDGGELHLSEGRWYQAPGQTEDMRILDFDGARFLVFTSWFPTTPAAIRTQLDQMVDSMEIATL